MEATTALSLITKVLQTEYGCVCCCFLLQRTLSTSFSVYYLTLTNRDLTSANDKWSRTIIAEEDAGPGTERMYNYMFASVRIIQALRVEMSKLA